jgi:cysteine desulfurase
VSQTIKLDENASGSLKPGAWQSYAHAVTLTGEALRNELLAAYETVAKFLGCDSQEIVFTSGGTEADALALQSSLNFDEKPHVITSSIEHAAVRNALSALHGRGDIELSVVSADRDGRVRAEHFAQLLRDETKLVSCIMASNETGVIQPIEELATLCEQRGVLLHTDAVQAVGRIPINIRELGVHMLSLSGHKLGAMQGVGALYVRAGTPMGDTRWRPQPTPHELWNNIPGASSLAAACSLTDPSRTNKVEDLRNYLEVSLANVLDDIEIIGASNPRLGNTSCVRFAGCEGDGILMSLDLEGIYVSTGSACSSGSIEPSPALLAMGYSETEARETVRFSLAHNLTQEQIQRVVESVTKVVGRMRST